MTLLPITVYLLAALAPTMACCMMMMCMMMPMMWAPAGTGCSQT